MDYNANNILDQVEKTSVYVNTHTNGHFISKAQLAQLRRILDLSSTPAESEDEVKHSIDKLDISLKLEQLKADRSNLVVAIEQAPKSERSALNSDLGQVDSEIAKLRRLLKKL